MAILKNGLEARGGFFSILMLFTLISTADFTSDSLKTIWENKNIPDSTRFDALRSYYPRFVYSEPDATLEYTKYHRRLAQQSENKEEISTANNEMAIAYYVIGQNDSAIALMSTALELRLELGDTLVAAKFMTNLAGLYRTTGDYLKAFRMTNKALQVYTGSGDKNMQAVLLSDLGIICYEVSKNELALDYLQQSMALYDEVEEFWKKSEILYKLAAVYYELEEYDKTQNYADKAIESYGKDSIKFGYAYCLTLKATAYNKVGEIDSGLYYINKSLSINRRIGNKDRIINCNLELAELLLSRDVKQAKTIAEETMQLLNDGGQYKFKSRLYDLLHRCYKQENEYSKALQMHELYAAYTDSAAMQANDMSLMKELIQKDFDKILEENESETEQLRNKQKKRIMGLMLFGIIVICGIYVYANKKISHKNTEQQKLLQEITLLKSKQSKELALPSGSFKLDRGSIENAISKKLNDTDWKVLTILIDDPVISNKKIAEKSFLSVEGISSALRRMYVTFDIKESKYKKISLLMEVIKLSNNP